MMNIQKGTVVCATCGRDEGRYFIVIDEIDDAYVYIADGKTRKIEKPKKKKKKHLIRYCMAEDKLLNKLLAGETVTNSELRKSLSIYTETSN